MKESNDKAVHPARESATNQARDKAIDLGAAIEFYNRAMEDLPDLSPLSKINRSGRSSRGDREPQGCSSRTPHCTSAASALALPALMYVAVPPLSGTCIRVTAASTLLSACFW